MRRPHGRGSAEILPNACLTLQREFFDAPFQACYVSFSSATKRFFATSPLNLCPPSIVNIFRETTI